MQAELLINVASRRSKDSYTDVVAACKNRGIALTRITKLTNPKRLNKALEKIVARKPTLLIVGSGDGTVSDVVDVLADTDIQLGIVPLGTTNNFARSLGIPLGVEAAVGHIVSSKAKKIDLGLVNDDYFANVAGIGISAEIAETIPDSLKKRYGRLAYGIHGLRVLMSHRPFHAVIQDKQGKLITNIRTHQLIVANGKYHAGTEIAGDTSVSSSNLVIFKLGGTSRLSLIWHMIDFYIGRRSSVSHTSYLIAKDVLITTKTAVRIELDGETKEKTPANIRIKPSVLKVRY